MTRTFGRIGCLSFGGPAAQIALMHKELVETKNWLSEEDFLRALSFCMLLPGPEAMQLATYAGWRLRGIAGGLLAGLLFVGPGAVVIAALVWLYTLFGALPLVQAGFLGIKAAVIVIVVQALARIGRKALKDRTGQAVAIAGFLAVFLLNLPFPLVVALAAGLGLLLRPEMTTPEAETVVHVGRGHWRNVALWAALWLVPLAGLTWIGAEFLATLGWFFAKLAVVTFGGAYAVLAYVTQTVVSDQGWITTGQMIDALGLAETTPGPLVLVTQFVAMLAGHGQGGVGLAVAAGVVALWATFAPCFLWIFAAAPYLEHLTRLPRLQGALSAITAAVAGMMLNLSLWFTLHLLFRELAPTSFGVNLPVWSSLDTHALVLVGLAPLVHRLCGGKLVLLLIVMATVGVLTGAFR
ncbi:chromate efflux transporter [Tritonibacter multivorans]|nr:chromate efflux transporter [Tritonibacter multivorans]